MAESDPMVQRVLNDPLMVEPDLASQNMANAALGFEIGQPLPPENAGSTAIIAAREDALALLGGSTGLKPLPEPLDGVGLSPVEGLNAIGRARRLDTPDDCLAAARFSAIWAARLPAALAAYPRGSVREAIGTDRSDCTLRVAIYLTPVPVDEVLAFHRTQAVNAGYVTRYAEGGDWHMLSGSMADSRFEISARTLPSGLVEMAIASVATS